MSDKQEEVELKVGEDEKPVTVELKDSTKEVESDGDTANIIVEEPESAVVEEQKPVSVAKQEEVKKEESKTKEDEIEEYSDKVKKRINKLTARAREAERQKEAAIEFAQNVQAQQEELKKRYVSSDEGRVSETKNRIETQVVALKQVIKKARQEDDIDTETEAQERLSGLLYEQNKLRDEEPRRKAYFDKIKEPVQPVQNVQQKAPYDPKAERWAEENEWFGKDTAMTHAAMGLHKQLVTEERFDPTSDEYYDELNKRLRDTFPQKMGVSTNNSDTRPVQSVAPANRSSGINTARRKVRLTPSQVAIAKKLGVPLEEYAKYVK